MHAEMERDIHYQRKHYASETQIRKDKAKEYSGTKAFVYSFKLMDIESKMYVNLE